MISSARIHRRPGSSQRSWISLITTPVTDCQGPLIGSIESLDDIRRWFDWLIEQNTKHSCPGCPLGTLASELADCDEAARVDLVSGLDTWMSYVIDGLGRMQAHGELVEQADPQRLGHAIFASLQGGLLLSKTTKDPQYLSDALEAAYDHLVSLGKDHAARLDLLD
jgi:hypothetical protein